MLYGPPGNTFVSVQSLIDFRRSFFIIFKHTTLNQCWVDVYDGGPLTIVLIVFILNDSTFSRVSFLKLFIMICIYSISSFGAGNIYNI